MSIKHIIVCIILTICFSATFSQVPTEAEAREELEKRGVDEAELRAELLKKGIDLDNINTNDPAELLRTQKTVEQVMAELEAKNKEKVAALKTNAKTANSTTKSKETDVENIINDNEAIQEAVENGATLDEAISEEIQENVKEKLPDAVIYGHHLFRNNSVKYYRKSEDAKPPSNYILGPGDQVSIAIWGRAELNFSQEISSDGFIKPDRISRIYIAGLSIKEAKDVIKRKLSRSYPFTDDTFEVTVNTSRTINVNITGEVFNVGSYSISALNNAFNALVAAGGPSNIGSVRNIKIARSGEPSRNLDLYQFIQDPTRGDNLYLNENDYIIVPWAEKVVEIRGAINRPYKYELLDKENLNKLIEYAAGLKATALKRSVKVTRIENDKLVILNINLAELADKRQDFALKNGDIIDIQSIATEYENIVSVSGAVELPGEYAFKKNMHINDLLKLAKPAETAILNTAYLVRLNDDQKTVRYKIVDLSQALSEPSSPENIELLRGDKLIIRSKSSFADSKSIEVSGAVKIEGSYAYNADELRVSDAIFLSGGLTEVATDFAFIYREKPGVSYPEYINVNLDQALSGVSNENLIMLPGDKLIVYNRKQYEDRSYITVSGAVKNPQELTFDSSLTVKKALLLSGGLTFNASLEQIDVFRLDFADNKKTRTLVANIRIDEDYNVLGGYGTFRLSPFDQIYVRKAPEFEVQRTVNLVGEVKYPGTYALVSDNTKLTEIIKLAGGTTEEAFLGGATLKRSEDDIGYIIVDLNKAIKKPKSAFNAILQKGDVINIPKRNDLVTVTGAVSATKAFTAEIAATGKFNFVYEPGKNAKYYVDKYAGGIAKNGRASKITVTYPNGEVKKTTKFLFFNDYPKVEPGSIINVGYKDVKEQKSEGEKEEIDWGKVLSDSIAQATTILTLVILINNLD